ncbi:glycoside hydrolase family 92 protein, partial [Staphylococcus aureus]|nr:glycoside hydrolase family 92 protein [Staphylococcus aureus]
VDLQNGRTLRIRAQGNAPDRPYVQSVWWNDKAWTRNWISHADLIQGGELVFKMGGKPSRFGTAPADRPPSLSSPRT